MPQSLSKFCSGLGSGGNVKSAGYPVALVDVVELGVHLRTGTQKPHVPLEDLRSGGLLILGGSSGLDKPIQRKILGSISSHTRPHLGQQGLQGDTG